MQALKALVIFMGVLILAGMALLIYGLMTRSGGGGKEAVETGVPAPAVTAPAPALPLATVVDFGTLELAIPDGCSIAGSELAGDRLVVRFTGQVERGCQQLVIVDLITGRELGRVKAQPPTVRMAP